MKNQNTLVLEDNSYIGLFLQLFNIALIIFLIYIAYIFFKKIWLFLDKAIEYLDKKNNPYQVKRKEQESQIS